MKKLELKRIARKPTYKKTAYSPFLAFFPGVAAGGLAVLIFANKKSIFDTVLNFIKKLFK